VRHERLQGLIPQVDVRAPQQLASLVLGEGQVGGADLRHGASHPVTLHRQQRVHPAEQDETQAGADQPQQELQLSRHVGAGEPFHLVQDEHHRLVAVEQIGGQADHQVVPSERPCRDARAVRQLDVGPSEGLGDEEPEVLGELGRFAEGQPDHPPWHTGTLHPVRGERRLPRPRQPTDQGERGVVHARTQPFGEPLPP